MICRSFHSRSFDWLIVEYPHHVMQCWAWTFRDADWDVASTDLFSSEKSVMFHAVFNTPIPLSLFFAGMNEARKYLIHEHQCLTRCRPAPRRLSKSHQSFKRYNRSLLLSIGLFSQSVLQVLTHSLYLSLFIVWWRLGWCSEALIFWLLHWARHSGNCTISYRGLCWAR
jgi:hypothetical protein